MKLFLRSSGGIANIQIQGEIDTDDLPPDIAKRVEDLLNPSKLKNKAGPENPYFADGQQISVRIQSEEDSVQLELDESTANPELFALCRELMGIIVRRKAGRK